MSEVEKRLVADYARLLKSLSREAKQELIGVLSESLGEATPTAVTGESKFDGYIAEMSAEEIIEDLRKSRHFREKDLEF